MKFSVCPECGAEYPDWHSPIGYLGCFCDLCGYATGDVKERHERGR